MENRGFFIFLKEYQFKIKIKKKNYRLEKRKEEKYAKGSPRFWLIGRNGNWFVEWGGDFMENRGFFIFLKEYQYKIKINKENLQAGEEKRS